MGIAGVFSFLTFGSLTADTGADYCWKDSYGRGAGTIPEQPPTGQFRHWFSDEWYACPTGYYRSLNPDINAKDACLKDNPAYSEWEPAKDLGPIIAPKPNGRAFKDPGYNRWFSCPSGYVRSVTHVKSSSACIKQGTIWPNETLSGITDHGVYHRDTPSGGFGDPNSHYYKCPKGFNRTIFPVTAANACEKVVPAKSVSKAKAKKMGSVCGSKEVDAGLCYDSCKSGYTGVGPVCWTSAPSDWVECGMGAAKDDKACAAATANQVVSVGMLAINIGSMGSANAKKAKDIDKLSDLEKKLAKLKKAYKAFEQSKNGKKIIKTGKAASKVKKAYDAKKEMDKAQTEEDIIRVSAMIASLLDPTGVADVVAAYAYPLCSKRFQ